MPSPLTKIKRDTERTTYQHNLHSGITQVSDAASEPVSVSDMKAWLRVDVTDDDSLIGSLITSARRMIEEHVDKSMMSQTWKLTLDGFPSASTIDLPRGPVQSVSSVKSYDEDDTESTFSTASYFVDTSGDRIGLNLDYTWPADLRPTNAAIITYVTGYGSTAASVPEDLKMAIRLLVGHWYENREAVGGSAQIMPLGVSALLTSHRTLRL